MKLLLSGGTPSDNLSNFIKLCYSCSSDDEDTINRIAKF